MDDTTETPSAGAPSATGPSGGPYETPASGALSMALAGLQAGMIGVLWMLFWLGIDSSWDRRGFWSEANLFSSAFYGDDAIRAGFGSKTMPGLALYLIVYSLLGCIFALALRNRIRPMRTFLAALVFAMGWFYISFHLLWKGAMPLVYLLYADRPMAVGHLIYGACLARFPGYVPAAKLPSVDVAIQETALREAPAEAAAQEAGLQEYSPHAALREIPHSDSLPGESPRQEPAPPQAS